MIFRKIINSNHFIVTTAVELVVGQALCSLEGQLTSGSVHDYMVKVSIKIEKRFSAYSVFQNQLHYAWIWAFKFSSNFPRSLILVFLLKICIKSGFKPNVFKFRIQLLIFYGTYHKCDVTRKTVYATEISDLEIGLVSEEFWNLLSVIFKTTSYIDILE